ncbi:hypothetical protein D3C84_1109010 [compost metagenome]
MLTLNTIFRVDDFRAVITAFNFTIGSHATACCQTIFHRCVEVKEPHGEDAGTIADLAGQHTAATKTDIAAQDLAFHCGVNAWQQVVNWIKASTVFIT